MTSKEIYGTAIIQVDSELWYRINRSTYYPLNQWTIEEAEADFCKSQRDIADYLVKREKRCFYF